MRKIVDRIGYRDPQSLLRQGLRFAMLTGASAGMTLGIPIVLHEGLGVRPDVAVAIAFAVAFAVNFLSMRRLVFRSTRGLGRDLRTYAASSLAFRAAEYGAFLLLDALRVHYVVALVGVLAVSALAKFFWYRRALHR